MRELRKRGSDHLAQLGQVACKPVHMEVLLLQLAPAFLDRIGPRGVGRRRHELNGNVEVPPLAGLLRTGIKRP